MATRKNLRGKRRPERDGAQRRLLIAEAALTVLSEAGARGLSHRAVDAKAKLPPGSTSYYFRTRDALVAAAAARLCELDVKDVEETAEHGGAPVLLERWAARGHRSRLVARFELFLDATRNPKTRVLIRKQRLSFLRAAQHALEKGGAPDAAARGELLVATVDGLLLAHLLGTEHPFAELCRDAARALTVSPRAKGRSLASGSRQSAR